MSAKANRCRRKRKRKESVIATTNKIRVRVLNLRLPGNILRGFIFEERLAEAGDEDRPDNKGDDVTEEGSAGDRS
jgi:hypothetical protein